MPQLQPTIWAGEEGVVLGDVDRPCVGKASRDGRQPRKVLHARFDFYVAYFGPT
jgi:hypothetical protein